MKSAPMNDAVVRVSLSFSLSPSRPPPLEAGEFGPGGALPAVPVQLAAPAPAAVLCPLLASFPSTVPAARSAHCPFFVSNTSVTCVVATAALCVLSEETNPSVLPRERSQRGATCGFATCSRAQGSSCGVWGPDLLGTHRNAAGCDGSGGDDSFYSRGLKKASNCCAAGWPDRNK